MFQNYIFMLNWANEKKRPERPYCWSQASPLGGDKVNLHGLVVLNSLVLFLNEPCSTCVCVLGGGALCISSWWCTCFSWCWEQVTLNRRTPKCVFCLLCTSIHHFLYPPPAPFVVKSSHTSKLLPTTISPQVCALGTAGIHACNLRSRRSCLEKVLLLKIHRLLTKFDVWQNGFIDLCLFFQPLLLKTD